MKEIEPLPSMSTCERRGASSSVVSVGLLPPFLVDVVAACCSSINRVVASSADSTPFPSLSACVKIFCTASEPNTFILALIFERINFDSERSPTSNAASLSGESLDARPVFCRIARRIEGSDLLEEYCDGLDWGEVVDIVKTCVRERERGGGLGGGKVVVGRVQL